MVSNIGLAKDATNFKVAILGQVYSVARALVSHEGYARPFWPPLATETLSFNDVQRDLVEIKNDADADCSLTFFPAGNVVGDADTSGAFDETWSQDYPSADPTGFTVTVTLISGEAPVGDAFDTPLTLDTQRSWTLTATTGENKVAVMDVSVTDGTLTVVKRVTMHSQRVDGSFMVMPNGEWCLIDIEDIVYPLPFEVYAQINVNADGSAVGRTSDEPEVVKEFWNAAYPLVPDGYNYECRLERVSGFPVVTTGFDPLNTWLPLTQDRVWKFRQYVDGHAGPSNELLVQRDYEFVLNIRRIGGPKSFTKICVTLHAKPSITLG